MKLSKPVKIVVAAGTAWIILYLIFALLRWASALTGIGFLRDLEAPISAVILSLFFVGLQWFTIIVHLALVGFYLVHIARNASASDELRVIFSMGIFVLPYLAMPVYYYLFIWRDQPPAWATKERTLPAPQMPGDDVTAPALQPPKPFGISRKSLYKIGGCLAAGWLVFAILVVFFVVFLINRFIQQKNQEIYLEPTLVPYQYLPVYLPEEKPLYQPVELDDFLRINEFKGIDMWRNYNLSPMLIKGEQIILAGYIQEPEEPYKVVTNIDLVSANVHTGEVKWQAMADSAFLLRDGARFYAPAADQLNNDGISAYDIDSGELLWETRLGYDITRINHVALTEAGLEVGTDNTNGFAQYLLDPRTGKFKIKEPDRCESREAEDEVQVYQDLILSKRGYGVPGGIVARKQKDNAFAWLYDAEPVVSNIAVGGAVTYVLTEKATWWRWIPSPARCWARWPLPRVSPPTSISSTPPCSSPPMGNSWPCISRTTGSCRSSGSPGSKSPR